MIAFFIFILIDFIVQSNTYDTISIEKAESAYSLIYASIKYSKINILSVGY